MYTFLRHVACILYHPGTYYRWLKYRYHGFMKTMYFEAVDNVYEDYQENIQCKMHFMREHCLRYLTEYEAVTCFINGCRLLDALEIDHTNIKTITLLYSVSEGMGSLGDFYTFEKSIGHMTEPDALVHRLLELLQRNNDLPAEVLDKKIDVIHTWKDNTIADLMRPVEGQFE